MSRRLVFYSGGDAHATVERLTAQGFTAGVARERFAGEDDDEDHAWAVVTDAPEPVLAVLRHETGPGDIGGRTTSVGDRPYSCPYGSADVVGARAPR